MSSIKIVIKKGAKKVSFENHYSVAMEIMEGNTNALLNSYLNRYSGRYDPSPIDAGVVIFDMDKKTLDARNQGGFNSGNLKRFPQGWKMLEIQM